MLKQLKTFYDKEYLFAGCRNEKELEIAEKLQIKPVIFNTYNIVEEEDIATIKKGKEKHYYAKGIKVA